MSLNTFVSKKSADIGIHVGFVCSQIPQIYGGVVLKRNAKNGIILVAVVGGGWAGYQFLATPSGQKYTSFEASG